MSKDDCKHCGATIQVAIFKGSGYCSVICRKADGADVSSVGTFMFVTTDEAAKIRAGRNGAR